MIAEARFPMGEKKKRRAWIKKRHSIVIALLKGPFGLYTKAKYKIKLEKFKNYDGGQYLIISNHQTAFDQFFISLCFPKHVYYVASEDLFSMGWLSKLITWLVAPVPFRKSTSDLSSVRNCIRIAREGGSISIFPEGNRTFSGTTEYMKSSIASLAKTLKLPIAFYRIEGGYGAHPRWSDEVRKGKMRGYFSRVLRYEEFKDMSNEELFDIIKKELYVDEREDKTLFCGRNNAEYLDRVMYVCPYCGLSEFYSKKDIIACKKCKRQIRYLPDKQLKGIDFEFPYTYVKDWYDHQCEFIRRLDLSPWSEKPIYTDKAKYSENIYCKKKTEIDKNASLSVFSDRFTVKTKHNEDVYLFSEVSAATVLGKNKLNIYVGDKIFQFKGDKHFNAVKYLNIYCHAVNTAKGDPYGEFLGL